VRLDLALALESLMPRIVTLGWLCPIGLSL
jgi:hypothetical protein